MSAHQRIIDLIDRVIAEQNSETLVPLIEELRKELAEESARLQAMIAKEASG